MKKTIEMAAVLTLLATMACNPDESEHNANYTTPDAGVADAGVDADVDASIDASTDTGMDAGTDTGVDAGVDTGTEDEDMGVDMDPPECETGSSRCVDGLQQTCGEDEEWGEPDACVEGSICANEACEAVSETLRQQGDVLTEVSASIRDYTGYAESFDFAGILTEATRRLYLGDQSLYNFYKQVFYIFDSVPQGHAALGLGALDYADCFSPTSTASIQLSSWYSACGRRHGDSSIVTFVEEGSTLDLSPGDRIVSLKRNDVVWGEQDGFLKRLSLEPVCAASIPNPEARLENAAINLFGMIKEGDVLSVVRVDGTEEDITAGARNERTTRCSDPLNRPERVNAFTTYRRDDGVVVIILPTLGNHPDRPFPMTLTFQSYRDWVAGGITAINEELATYDTISGIVWDIRGNTGGAQELGIALMDSFSGMSGSYGNCYARVPESLPATFSVDADYPLPYTIFVEDPLPSVAFEGPQVLLTDGAAVSAADWMALAATNAGIPVFGNRSMGSYGYQTGDSFVDRSIPPAMGIHEGINLFVSGARCVNAAGDDIEGLANTRHIVEFEPADLAAGIDTQLEQAAASLGN